MADFLSCVNVVPDRGVDAGSLESIVRDVTRGAASHEDRVLALFHWYRRVFFHHRSTGADSNRRDALKAIHSLGYNLCGSQTAVFVMLLRQAGYRTRVVVGEAPGDFGGHTFCEVYFEERWHCLDPMTSFFVYTRGERRHIAGLDELRADRSLVTRAAAEGRAPPAFLYCALYQERRPPEKAWLASTMGEADLTWSTLLFHSGSLLDFWAQAPQAIRVLDEEGAYGGRYLPGTADITLRPGEILVRPWDQPGLWIGPLSHSNAPPHHTCGTADEHDPVNFKFFEPYLKPDVGVTRRCYRHAGNGWQEWKPEATLPAAAIGEASGLRWADNQGTLESVGAGPGLFVLPWRSPYAVLQIEIDIELEQAAGTLTTVAVRGREQPEPPPWVEIVSREGAWAGTLSGVYTCREAAFYHFEVRLAHEGAPVRMRISRLKTRFQLNPAVLPTLYPGENLVTVSAAATGALDGHRLWVTYEWEEGLGWGNRRIDTQTVETFPFAYRVHVDMPDNRMPRMKRLDLALKPRGWTPTTQQS